MPYIPQPTHEGYFTETKWVIELRRSSDPTCGRRQVRVFHYGELIDNRWIRDWEYPQNSYDDEEEFYICVTPDQLYEPEDDHIPREDRGGNVGLWIKVIDSVSPPHVDLYYTTSRRYVADDSSDGEEFETVTQYEYETLFATEYDAIG